jgi:three-Cys-motif partner protein
LTRDRQDDAIVAQTAGHWAREKLHFLECYAPAFVQACRNAENGCFIDAFAGPGWNEDRLGRFEGSPLIATRYPFRNIFLIDKELAHIRSLQGLGFGPQVTILEGDANRRVLEALQSVPAWLPALIFLDQFSNQVSYATLQGIAQWSEARNRKPELLILLPTAMALQRLFPVDGPVTSPDTLTRVYGSEEVWRPIEEARMAGRLPRTRLIQALTERYMELLKSDLGYLQEPLCRHIRKDGESGIFLYTLVFATDHPLGRKIMESCFRHRHSGQQTLC